MKSKQIFFFAELADVEIIFKNDIESVANICYYLIGLFNQPSTLHFNSIHEIKNLGTVNNGDWNHIDDYLVMPKTIKANVRIVPQKDGNTKYAFDQMINMKSVALKFGGIYKDGILVAGRVGTISTDSTSIDLYKLISSKIKKNFHKVGDFYVSKEAMGKLESGWRLVTNVNSPQEYDFKKQ
ncbi:MAG: hypothetical protein JWN78_3013 [Bacteroidota bacterium]|nr:hypothetical protein [Bacteroidota bacterium]